jgi:hypothetical protein
MTPNGRQGKRIVLIEGQGICPAGEHVKKAPESEKANSAMHKHLPV